MRTWILAALAALIISRPIESRAAAQSITYQGQLKESGVPVSGTRSIIFRICNDPSNDCSSAPALLWQSSALSVNVSSGIFRTSFQPVLLASDLENSTLWLELLVGGVVLSPREQLTTTPYAIDAQLHMGKKYTSASSAPSGPNAGDLWLDTSVSPDVLKVFNGTAWGAVSGASAVGITLAPASPDVASSANSSVWINDTGGGNLFRLQQNGADKFVIDNTGQITSGSLGSNIQLPNGNIDSSSVTKQGNSFNAAGKLVQLDGSSRLPAVDGSLLTNLAASASVYANAPINGNGTSGNPLRIDSSSATLQGNAFNAANKLVQLDGSSRLPTADGSLLNNLNAGSIANGPISASLLPSTVAYASIANNFTAGQTISATNGLSVTNGLTVGSVTINSGGNLRMSGINGDPASPADGDYWVNTSQKSHRFKETVGTVGLGGLLFAQTQVLAGDIVSNTASETNFAENYSIPANSLTAGKVIRVTARGVFGTQAVVAPTLTLKVKMGSIAIGSSSAASLSAGLTNQGWTAEFTIIVIGIGASGSVEGQGVALFSSVSALPNTSTVTLDTTSSQTLQLSATWSAANASNTITLRQMIVEVLN